MTVSTEVDHNDYTGNGVTTSFPYTFRIFQKSDLMVQVADLNENITVLTLDTDYAVTGAGGYSGGAVVLASPLANGWQISISRELPVTQETDLRNQGKFFAEVHEDAFDKLTMLIQQCFGFLRLALRKPSFIANYYDALNNRIRNLRDPSQAQDAATKHYVDDSVAGSNSHADNLFKRTLRVPEGSVNQLYPVTGRRNSLLGFDSNGDPVPIFSMTDTADLAIKLASHEKGLGASLVGLENRGTVQDALPDVYLPSYGVVIQPASMIAGTTAIGDIPAVDMTDKLIEAINDAKRLGVGLDTGIRSIFGPAPSGYVYVTKSVDFTGLKHVKGFIPLGVIPETFVPTLLTAENPQRGMLMRNMNARYDSEGKQYAYSTAVGPEFDGVGVYGLRDMPENIIGMVHTTAYSHFNGPVWARRFATGIYLANTYDISIASQWAAVDCGSMNYPPLMVGTYPAADVPDESNSITFPRLLLHSNKYRDAEIIGSKINVNAIHAEDCTIGSLTGMRPRGFDQFAPGGIASLVIATTGGVAGNVNYTINRNSTSNGCLLVNMLGTHVNNIYADRNIIDIKISDVYFLGRGGSIGSIYTDGSLYTDGGSEIVIGSAIVGGNLSNKNVYSHITRATVTGNVDNSGTIDKLTCKGAFSQDQYGVVNGGTITGNATLTASGELNNVTINGNLISSAGGPRLKRVTVNGQWMVSGGGRFEYCTMPGFDIKSVNFTPTYIGCNISSAVTSATANGKSIFRDCSVATYNFDNSNNAVIRLYGGSAGGISMNQSVNPMIIIDGLACSSGNSLPGWTQPLNTGVGFGVKTINPYTGAGWMLLNNNGTAAWLPIKTYQ